MPNFGTYKSIAIAYRRESLFEAINFSSYQTIQKFKLIIE
jgi:hypothetical protein